VKWMSVERHVPNNSREVMVHAPTAQHRVTVGCYYDDQAESSWTVYDACGSELDGVVTHWMELPDVP